MVDSHLLVPRHKADMERAPAAVDAGYPAVAPVLHQLMEWLQDYNWPVAHVLAPFLASIGAPLAPHVRYALDSKDDTWKYWTVSVILGQSRELAEMFRADIERLAWTPTQEEAHEEVNEVAQEVLQGYGWERLQ